MTETQKAREQAAYTQTCPKCAQPPQVQCVRINGRDVAFLEHPHEERQQLGDLATGPDERAGAVHRTPLPRLGGVTEVAAVTGKQKTHVSAMLKKPGAPQGQQLAAGPVWVLNDAVTWVTTGRLKRETPFAKVAGAYELAAGSGRTRQWASVMLQDPGAAHLIQRLAMGPVCAEADGLAFLRPRRKPGPAPRRLART